MTCFREADGSASVGAGTLVEGMVSNLIVTLEAQASAAFWSSSRRTVLEEQNQSACCMRKARLRGGVKHSAYHSPEYRANTLSMSARVFTVTASSSFPEPKVRAFKALKSISDMMTKASARSEYKSGARVQE